MLDPKTVILSALTKYTDPSRYALICEETELDDLRLHPIDRQYSLSSDIEERLGVEFPDRDVDGWVTVGDMIRSAERLMVREAA